MSAPAALVRLVEPWSHLYSDSKVIPTIVQFTHIAALVVAGGFAIALDRATLRAARGSHDERRRHLVDLGAAHRVVIGGLSVSAVSGLLLFTADIENFFTSGIFWTKATMIALLLANGYWMTRTEARMRADPDAIDASWPRLNRAARTSFFLWFAIAFAGVALVNLS